jgi:hypothetical protein
LHDLIAEARWRAVARLFAALVTVLVLAVGVAAVPAAAGPPGTGGFANEFAVGSALPGHALGYFDYYLAAGGRISGALAVYGEDTKPITLDVYASNGVTSPNSGDAYVGDPSHPCSATGCWITGLPGKITLSYRERRIVTFTVDIPADAADGQYLAGVTIQPASLPKLHQTGAPGGESVLVHQVTIGVAVSVGTGFTRELVIPDVTGTRIGNDPAVIVEERDTGRGFEHPVGAITIETPHYDYPFRVASGTVLPGGQAGLRVLAPGVTPGSYAASVYLRYDDGLKTAYWNGVVVIPGAGAQPVTVTPGEKLKVVQVSSTGWALWALIGVLAALALAGIWWFLVGRRRRRPAVTAADG